ncbi:MAG: hypothetical protein EBX50_14110 [Chitinophagia bacterium]|nr:hypothetical protein [Chitinophagia bacterium]
MKHSDFILSIYQDKRTVFRLADIAMLFPEAQVKYLSERMSYYVKTGRLYSLRRGVYAKPNYNPLELANMLFTPSYVSLEYVLQQAGVIFQYDSRITCISYLSRDTQIDGKTYSYRRIKEEIVLNPKGVIQNDAGYSIATAERAFLDLLYLNKDFYVDNLMGLNQALIEELVAVYQSKAVEIRISKLQKNVEQQ